ncbi:hypothetical protein [Pseudonocardia sp.]|uniref:hypothetical protein n=1 Tax=Pseudonocardia sp. TaxID=60912 RepID=UPI002617CA72|nr:hypothetical protein [Pseudonocardia sp.]
MACSHTAACPLFPLLNSSLEGWRRCYCDSADGWRGCARYQQSLRGQYVPLSLLPNGHDAHHLQSAAADRGAAAPPGGRAAGGAPTLVDLLFEHAPPREPVPADGDRQLGSLFDPPAPAPRAVQEPRPTRSWWTRLAEWMRTPA